MFAGKSTRPSQDPLSAEQARGLIRRVREKEVEAVAEAARHVAQAEAASELFCWNLGWFWKVFRSKTLVNVIYAQTLGSMGVHNKIGWFHTQHDQHLSVTGLLSKCRHTGLCPYPGFYFWTGIEDIQAHDFCYLLKFNTFHPLRPKFRLATDFGFGLVWVVYILYYIYMCVCVQLSKEV